MTAGLPPLVRALLDDLAQNPDARDELRRALAPEDPPGRLAGGRVAYTAATLAAELGITPRAVRAAIARGDLDATKHGARWIISRQAVEGWACPDVSPRAARARPQPGRRRAGRPMADALAILDRAA